MGVEVFIKGSGGAASIPPFIRSNGTINTLDSDAYIETVPFRSDSTVIANNLGKYLEDIDNPNLGLHSNLFRHSENGDSWWFGDGSFGVGYDVIDRHNTFGPVQQYGGLLEPYPWPTMAQYQAVQVPLGENFFPTYYEDGRFIYPGDYGSDDYMWTDADVPNNNIESGWYKAIYGLRNRNAGNPLGDYFQSDFSANIVAARWRYLLDETNSGGLSHRGELWMDKTVTRLVRTNPGHPSGGEDQWGMDDRGSFMFSPPTRPAYYKSNPSCETIASEPDHFVNVDYANCTKVPLSIPSPFSAKRAFNNLYTIAGNKWVSNGLESERRSKTYMAIFYVNSTTGSNAGSTTAERKNNPFRAYQTLASAWPAAKIHQDSTGEEAVVWMMPGVHTSGSNICRDVDLYFDHKAILTNTNSLGTLNDFSNGANVQHGNFDILGHGIIYNPRNYNSVDASYDLGAASGIQIIRGGRIFGNIELEFVDQIQSGGYNPPPFTEWYEAEFKIKEYWSRAMFGRTGVARWPGIITFVDTTFLHGITSDQYVQTNNCWYKFNNCTFTAPYFGAPGVEIYRENGTTLLQTLPTPDDYDTSGFTSSQQVADDCGWVAFNSANPGIKALVELLPSTGINFTNTITRTKWTFNDCSFLINKSWIFAVALVTPAPARNYSSYGENNAGHVTINGGEVFEWSGVQGGSAFYVAHRYTTGTRDNPYFFEESIKKWTGDNFGWKKYIDAPTVTNPEIAASWADGEYIPLPNRSKARGKRNSVDEVLDISGVTDGVWTSKTLGNNIQTAYPHSELELLIEAGGPGNPNISVFVRENGSTDINRGGDLTQHTQLTLSVFTDGFGEFELLQTDKTITNIKLISYISNRI